MFHCQEIATKRFRTISLDGLNQTCLPVKSSVPETTSEILMSQDETTSSIQNLYRYTNSFDFLDKVRSGMPPLVICVACNGGIQGKEANENIPETADEIAESVGAAYDSGAAMVHIH